jgi:hypothetical protein
VEGSHHAMNPKSWRLEQIEYEEKRIRDWQDCRAEIIARDGEDADVACIQPKIDDIQKRIDQLRSEL